MIIDSLSNLKDYISLNPLFQDVVDYINSIDLKNQGQGIVTIKGDDLYANFTIAKGKTKDQAKLETHDKMIDIQIPIGTTETMGYIPRVKLPESVYDPKNDITFYNENPENFINVNVGEFVIFFPQDAHAPCISHEEQIQKVIFKVKA